ncbi:hypothetical protein CECT7263_17673 [Bifidobacterium breve CECT 7263]|nr:hypothetical protein CECT7263_17673 [Bifidobacterium breve CECT 7263]
MQAILWRKSRQCITTGAKARLETNQIKEESMPVIHTHVSVSTTPEQREALKAAYGRAITAVPGKSEGWLMCPFEDNMPIYFGGSDDQPAAYVEVNVFGRSVPSSAWEKLTQDIMAALNSTLGVPEDRTYIRYTATTDWGWNGGNF